MAKMSPEVAIIFVCGRSIFFVQHQVYREGAKTEILLPIAVLHVWAHRGFPPHADYVLRTLPFILWDIARSFFTEQVYNLNADSMQKMLDGVSQLKSFLLD